MIRWLHISDLHIKNKADWNNFRKELFKKCTEIGEINLVIVTILHVAQILKWLNVFCGS